MTNDSTPKKSKTAIEPLRKRRLSGEQSWVSTHFGPIRQIAKTAKKAKAIELIGGMTHEQVAAKLNITTKTVSRWVKGSELTGQNIDLNKMSDLESTSGISSVIDVEPEPEVLRDEDFRTDEKQIEDAVREIVKLRELPVKAFEAEVNLIITDLICGLGNE